MCEENDVILFENTHVDSLRYAKDLTVNVQNMTHYRRLHVNNQYSLSSRL